MLDLPENLIERYRSRRGIELYLEIPTEQLDSAAIDAIPRDLLVKEADLMGAKWFDYRTLHPWQATALFLEAYRSEHAWVMRKREDVTNFWFHKGIKCSKLHNAGKHQMVAIWKARQAADTVGCPYDFYCRELLDWAEQRCWTNLPRMNQLYSDDHLQVMTEKWETSKRVKLRTATDPCYMRDAGDEPHQQAYREFLVAQARRRFSPEYALANLVYDKQHLNEDDVIEHFGPDTLRACKRVAVDLYPDSPLI
ncbi:hypothetical protein TW86_04095 [Halomonas sp. S2151]|uniref:hypothetical protein n=1 Tax=Halomonas sp. S2151 TaxID=579478 RepID=UPI0005FA89B6|nr:hypothetical protein [Halomonas sp. S2151]KJZ17441.1 hypothetical protein TW86_04095 [Halomonas sp. S2151]